MYYDHSFFPGFGLLGLIFQISWWALILWLFITVIRHFTGHNDSQSSDMSDTTDTALKILRERYAKGEITKKEFDSMKKDLAA
jgi:putative membrane protein